MTDPRLKTLAHSLVNYSCRVQPGDNVLIETFDAPDEVSEALIDEVYKAGGMPFADNMRSKVNAAILENATADQLDLMAKWDCARMADMQCYIAFRANENSMENASVPAERMQLYSTRYSKPVHSELRVKNTRWVVLRYPSPSMAQSAGMSTRKFEDFYFDVCNLDYAKMGIAMEPLVELMNRTDRVRIVGPGTDLTFSIKGIPTIKCDGHMNIPDGEVYTAPVRDSVNGTISYNTGSTYMGTRFENIKFTFKDGKIVEASANDTEKLMSVLDTDEGARFIGEFAIGVNPCVTSPMDDTLFDEKIAGSFHFTPGASYDDAYNGNDSAVHWDIVMIQTPEWGGGEIWFDDVLIRKDGLFVLPELEGLNPENLK